MIFSCACFDEGHHDLVRVTGHGLAAVGALIPQGRELAAPTREAVGILGLCEYVLLARGHSETSQGRTAVLHARAYAFGQEPVARGFDIFGDVVAWFAIVQPRGPVLEWRPLAFVLARLPRFCHADAPVVGHCEVRSGPLYLLGFVDKRVVSLDAVRQAALFVAGLWLVFLDLSSVVRHV